MFEGHERDDVAGAGWVFRGVEAVGEAGDVLGTGGHRGAGMYGVGQVRIVALMHHRAVSARDVPSSPASVKGAAVIGDEGVAVHLMRRVRSGADGTDDESGDAERDRA